MNAILNAILPDNSTFLDIGVVVIVSGSSVLAFWRGFLRELLGLGVWAAAILATMYGFRAPQEWVGRFVKIDLFVDIIAIGGLFLVALAIFSFIANRLRTYIHTPGPTDRLLGSLFGFFRGVLIVACFWLLFSWTFTSGGIPGWIGGAYTWPLFTKGASLVELCLPSKFRRDAEMLTAESLLRNSVKPHVEEEFLESHEELLEEGQEFLMEGEEFLIEEGEELFKESQEPPREEEELRKEEEGLPWGESGKAGKRSHFL